MGGTDTRPRRRRSRWSLAGAPTSGPLAGRARRTPCRRRRRGQAAVARRGATQRGSGSGVIGTDVGKQEQHQQRTAPGTQIEPKTAHHRVGVAGFDVPAVVAGIVGMREPDRESAQPGARDPPARAHELVVCGEQPRGVRRGCSTAHRRIRACAGLAGSRSPGRLGHSRWPPTAALARRRRRHAGTRWVGARTPVGDEALHLAIGQSLLALHLATVLGLAANRNWSPRRGDQRREGRSVQGARIVTDVGGQRLLFGQLVTYRSYTEVVSPRLVNRGKV